MQAYRVALRLIFECYKAKENKDLLFVENIQGDSWKKDGGEQEVMKMKRNV